VLWHIIGFLFSFFFYPVTLQVVSLVTGERLGPNQKGELWFKTPFLMTGYKDMPEVGGVFF
jgi:hypothetical protein